MPVVLFNRFLHNYYCVGIDNIKAGSKAALYFINKGITDIAVVRSKERYLAIDMRYKGFLDTWNKHKLEIKEENIISANNTIEGGIEAAEKFLSLSKPPKAIYCDSDYIAYGLVHLFNKKDIRIPEDVEIVAVGYM